MEGSVHVQADGQSVAARRLATRRACAEHGGAVPRRGAARGAVAPSDPCSFTTTASWGNIPSNPNRLAVQALCKAIIDNSDADPANNGQSVFNTGAAGPNGFARPGNPFFPLEIELRQGNPKVQPEVGDTFTMGLVLQFEHITASFDYYNIQIKDAIAPLNSLFAYQQCFNAAGGNPTLTYAGSPYCKLIIRNVQSGERSSVDAPFINTGSLETSGVDVTVTGRRTSGRARSTSTAW